MRPLVRLTVVTAVLGLACVGGAAPAPARPVRVIASFYPVYIATLNVTKGVPGVDVANLTKPFTGCLHDYQMTPEDMTTLARADLFVVNGAGMEAFLDKVRRQFPALKSIEASSGIDLLRNAADGEPNPHVWLSVALAIRQVQNIAAGLARADPSRAAAYQANAAGYAARLAALQARMVAGLQNVRSRDIITFHEAFPYFAREFNLNVVAVIEREPGSEPSARDLVETIRTVRRTGVKALFAEPQYPAKAAETIAAETGARVFTLDPVVTGPMAPDAYIHIMESNLATLVEALR